MVDGMNADYIIKAAIPDADDSLVSFILWGRTAFPFTEVTASMLYKAASRFKRASDKNLILCEFCDRLATNNFLCDECRKALNHEHI